MSRILPDLTQAATDVKFVAAKSVSTPTATASIRMAFKPKSIQHWRKAGDVRPPVGSRAITDAVRATTIARTAQGFMNRPSAFGKRTNVRTSSPHVTTVR